MKTYHALRRAEHFGYMVHNGGLNEKCLSPTQTKQYLNKRLLRNDTITNYVMCQDRQLLPLPVVGTNTNKISEWL